MNRPDPHKSAAKNVCKNLLQVPSIGEVMRLKRTLIVLLLLAAVPISWGRDEQFFSRSQKARKNEPKLSYQKDIQPLLSQYCFGCHGNGKKKGDVALDAYKNEASITKDQV